MKTTLTKTLALLLVLLATTLATRAGLNRGGRRGADHPARREIKAYVEQNVLPVLRQQRQQLEPQLAPTDQAQLVTYRTELKAL
ncbi:MAG: hypothetical protein H7Z21_12210, partial [Hymenobacter sp.]|nr:hypothetical protein [Hymenobacter sp.]